MFTCSKCNLLRAVAWRIVLPSGREVCAICFPDYFTLNARVRQGL